MPLPKMKKKKKKFVLAIVAMSLLKMEKKNCFGNCGNAIADNVKKKKKKKLFWQLWQSHCWKWEKKRCYEICERVKKKLSRPQYFYNIFTINHTWLVISWKKLWQTNCGNGIAEIGRKKKFVLNCGNAIAEIGRKKNFVLAIGAIPLPKM